jgi:hypothetical protein
MEDLPANVTHYLIGIPVFLFLFFRSYKNYRRLHNPLSGYFALTGLSAALAFAFWSLPLAFTHDSTILEISNAIGDLFLFGLYAISADLVHYLALRGRVSRRVFMTPVIILCIIGWLSDVYGYFHYGIAVVNDQFTYKLPVLSSVTQIILLVGILLVGVLLLTRLSEQKTNRGKLGLAGVAVLYIISSLAGVLNVIPAESINSPAIYGAYIIGFLIFVGMMIFARFKKTPTS